MAHRDCCRMHLDCRERGAELARTWLAEENAILLVAEANKKADKKKEQEKKTDKQGDDKAGAEDEASGKAGDCGAASGAKKAKDPTAYNPKADPNNIWEVRGDKHTHSALYCFACFIPPYMNDTCPAAVCPGAGGHSFTKSQRQLGWLCGAGDADADGMLSLP